ncbi:hypothetical protein JCM16303_002380 [Sporobolomyces ruberrimus]
MSDTQNDSPRYPSTLAPPTYYQGLTDRITLNLLPTFSRLFSSLPTTNTTSPSILELASGTGHHSLVYSNAFPSLTFQPTECDEFNRKRIDETCTEVRSQGKGAKGGVREAVQLDVMRDEDWENLAKLQRENDEVSNQFDLVIGHNFLHMIPFPEGPETIFRNLLKHDLVSRSHGMVAFYGPFKHDEGFYSDADVEFDNMIKARPSTYPIGLRSIDALSRIAQGEGWDFVEKVSMPKNNWVLVYKVKEA